MWYLFMAISRFEPCMSSVAHNTLQSILLLLSINLRLLFILKGGFLPDLCTLMPYENFPSIDMDFHTHNETQVNMTKPNG